MSKKKKYALIGVAFLIISFLSWISMMTFGVYSEGVRAGTLDKFSKKGVVFKTWEGELRIGTEDRINPQRFVFSVNENEKEVIQKLQDYNGKQVKLYYKQKYWVFPWQGDSEYFIYKVELVK
ncbi:hypothetical protein [Raineya orbicola]|uniref:6-phosphogluconate dehydrogenase n=1 Tax=Raineya orbicola TaxID=2016530 RepID=A0A2N3I8B5_9BACT|nr:hypothetical protein [Raineya orbicola]PKQ66557.1 hypothetical protein Rain11_2352 [Raineya orbicola]